MDIRDRVMGDQPGDFLHKIASIIPGYNGYVDRDKRRDADKLLRTELAKRYTAQRDRLNRVQQNMARSRQYTHIGEVDRIVGVFQRFIDRLNTATYGYTGLFDPVKVEASDLDQIYAFDMALAGGVDQVSSAIDSVDSASGDGQELPSALSRLADTVDELNNRLNQRSDYLTSGRKLPESEVKAMVSGSGGQHGEQASQQGQGYTPPAQGGYQPGSSYSQPAQQGYEPTSPPPSGYEPGATYGQPQQATYQPSQGAVGGYGQYTQEPQGSSGQTGGGSMTNEPNLGSGAYSQPGGGADVTTGDEGTGTPTTNLNMQSEIPNQPGMGQMLNEGQTGHGDMMQPTGMGDYGRSDPTMGGAPGNPAGGIQTASSPAHSTDPSSPGDVLSEGLSTASSLGTPDTGTGSGSALGDLPGTSTSTSMGGTGADTGSSTDVPPTNPGRS
jgi:hypothetical protein